jgi:hypothetical protein
VNEGRVVARVSLIHMCAFALRPALVVNIVKMKAIADLSIIDVDSTIE